MRSVHQWAEEYRGRGLAICAIPAGEKRPIRKNWNRQSCEPKDIPAGWNVGIQTGRLSGDLVCVDIDCHEALAKADDFLPPTNMVEGRPGKPKSHRWYRVTDLLPGFVSTAGVGDGPAIVRFSRGPKKGGMVVEVVGTGGQAVVPASVWSNGSRQEQRYWANFGEPRVVGHEELLTAVASLAAAFGGRNSRWASRGSTAARTRKRARGVVRESPGLELPPPPVEATELPELPMPTHDVARRARAYVAQMPPAVAGCGGDSQTWAVACVLVRDFGLSREDALPLLLEYNRRCSPPWSLAQLQHKLDRANQFNGERGTKSGSTPRQVVVCSDPEKPEVLVGLGVSGRAASAVDLSPGLWAGYVTEGGRYQLHPDLAGIPWRGKTAILAPASTITSNKGEVWEEYRLARLLRKAGARVVSLRLPANGGRRSTLADHDDWQALDTVPPPTGWQAVHRSAAAAGALAKVLDPSRKRLPRDRASPRLDGAIAFLRETKPTGLTKDLVERGKEAGYSKSTLARAWRFFSHSSFQTPPQTT